MKQRVALFLLMGCGGASEPAAAPETVATGASQMPTLPAPTGAMTSVAAVTPSAPTAVPAMPSVAIPSSMASSPPSTSANTPSKPETTPPQATPKTASGPVAPKPPAAPPPVTSVSVYVSNECATKVEYCVADGSTLNTSLGSNTSATHTVSPGAKIMLKNGSSCGNTVLTVPPSRDQVKFSICKR